LIAKPANLNAKVIYSVNSIEKSKGNIVSWVEIRWTWNWCRCHYKVEVASEGNGNEDRIKSGVLRGGGVRVRIDDTLHVSHTASGYLTRYETM